VSSLYDVGETAFVSFWTSDASGQLADADANPVAALTLPNGQAGTPPTVAHPGVGTYTVAVPLPVEGEYVLRTVATVGGSTRVDVRRLAALAASSAIALPAWAPSLSDVADHIPTRTRPTAEWGSSDAILGTFTDATTPTRDQAARIITRACAWVGSQLGSPVSPTVYQAAGIAAALRAAYWVEVAFPERDGDLSVYDRLAVDADTAATTARELNAIAGAQLPDPNLDGDLVDYSFPSEQPAPLTIIYPWYAPAQQH
jgi:hypothetical protein